MAQNITYNIGSVQNMANHNTEITINQSSQNFSITKGDFSSLAKFLVDKGISEPDIQELKDIIDTEPNLAIEGIKNNKIRGWMGKIAIEANLVARGVEVALIVEVFNIILAFNCELISYFLNFIISIFITHICQF